MSDTAELMVIEPRRLSRATLLCLTLVGLVAFGVTGVVTGIQKLDSATRRQNSSAENYGQPARYYLHELGINVEELVLVSVKSTTPSGVAVLAEVDNRNYLITVPSERTWVDPGPSHAFLKLDDSPIHLRVLAWTCRPPNILWYLFPYGTDPVCTATLTPEAAQDGRFSGVRERRVRNLLQAAVFELHVPYGSV
jgi:hypothetical protein